MKGRTNERPSLDLKSTIHVRCSAVLKDAVIALASQAGLEPSTWVRMKIMRDPHIKALLTKANSK